MIPRTRLWLSLSFAVSVPVVGAGAVLLCVLLARPELDRLAEARHQLSAEQLRSAHLHEAMQKARERIAAKEAIIRELTLCRLTLAEAAHAFRRLHEEAGEPIKAYPEGRSGTSEGERLRWQVIAWAECELHKYPARQARATLRRLYADFGAYRNHRASPAPAPHHGV